MSRPRHLVAVWNPSYARNAMEDHLGVLLAAARAHRASDGEVYVWWGKVHSPNRQQPQAHLDEILALDSILETDDAPEVHLYLTDYRSLYVGEVGEIRAGELPASEADHVPRYYAEQDLRCDMWFKLFDIRRLVPDDMLAVIEELKKLSNVHYNDRPVSIFGGMVDLPLVVTRPDGASFFDEDERNELTEGRLWAEFDRENGGGVGRMERMLREDHFGDRAWSALESSARSFIATGEKLFRDHRDDPAFDFAPCSRASPRRSRCR